jgi:hypothetical protein
LARGPRTLDHGQFAPLEQIARSLDDGRQWRVRIRRQEIHGADERFAGHREALEQRVEPLGADDVDTVAQHRIRAASADEQNRGHAAPGTGSVIGRQIPRVTQRLVECGARSVQDALELQDGHAAALQHDDVGTSRVARQFVLQDGGVLTGGGVAHLELAAFALQPRDRLVPGADLLGGGVGDECLQLEADDPRLGAGEGPQVRLPSVAVVEGLVVHEAPGSIRLGVRST